MHGTQSWRPTGCTTAERASKNEQWKEFSKPLRGSSEAHVVPPTRKPTCTANAASGARVPREAHAEVVRRGRADVLHGEFVAELSPLLEHNREDWVDSSGQVRAPILDCVGVVAIVVNDLRGAKGAARGKGRSKPCSLRHLDGSRPRRGLKPRKLEPTPPCLSRGPPSSRTKSSDTRRQGHAVHCRARARRAHIPAINVKHRAVVAP